MNAIAERWIGGCRRELLDRTLVWNQHHLRRILREYEIHHNQHRPHRSLHGAAPLKQLPEPVDLEQYRVRRNTRVGGLVNEYCLVAWPGRGFRHAHGRQQQSSLVLQYPVTPPAWLDLGYEDGDLPVAVLCLPDVSDDRVD